MKFVAHPLVVAAALGLLGPGALESASDSEADAAPHLRTSDHATPGHDGVAQAAPSLFGQLDETLFTVEAPSAEDLARVELQWKALGKA